MRHEIRRFAYFCDGMVAMDRGGLKRCSSVQVIDAATEKEADQLARMNGWEIDNRPGRGQYLCKERKHQKWARKATA